MPGLGGFAQQADRCMNDSLPVLPTRHRPWTAAELARRCAGPLRACEQPGTAVPAALGAYATFWLVATVIRGQRMPNVEWIAPASDLTAA